MNRYRVRCYREFQGWVYVTAKDKKRAVHEAVVGEYEDIKDEKEVSIRFTNEVEEVSE